jgi:hypothetical protein
MDWLLERQGAIQKKLAARHLSEGSLALYDLSSSYFEGQCCPLAKIGYSRDGKRNTPQVNYGLLTTRAGCPVAISVYEGNTADASTLMPQVKQLREQFGLERLVLIGDRGMISHKAIEGRAGCSPASPGAARGRGGGGRRLSEMWKGSGRPVSGRPCARVSIS